MKIEKNESKEKVKQMSSIIVKEREYMNLSEEKLERLSELVDFVCNKQCKGHLTPEGWTSPELDCSNCPFESVYDALNPID